MKLDTGTIITLVAMFIFYLRIMQLRGKKRRLEREALVAQLKGGKSAKKHLVKPEPKNPNAPPFKVTSWWLVGLALVLMLLGLGVRSVTGAPPILQEYWWVGTTLGTIVFWFCFKV